MPTPRDEVARLTAEAARTADVGEELTRRLDEQAARDKRLEQNQVEILEGQANAKIRDYVTWAIGIAVSVILIWFAVNVLTGRTQSRSALSILVDCTTASTGKDVHLCYERGTASQGGAIGKLTLAQIQVLKSAGECGYEPDRDAYDVCFDAKTAPIIAAANASIQAADDAAKRAQ